MGSDPPIYHSRVADHSRVAASPSDRNRNPKMDDHHSTGGNDEPTADNQQHPLRRNVTLTERRFDVDTLPADMRRVYGHLANKYGEEYGLVSLCSLFTYSSL